MEPFYNKLDTVFSNYRSLPNVEFEIRLGKIQNGSFDPNIGKEKFYKIMKGLKKYNKWEKVTKSNSTVYYFKNKQRLILDEDSGSQTLEIKEKRYYEPLSLTDKPLDARFSVSTEKYIGEECPDEDAEFSRTRKRESFIRKNLSIDMTIIEGTEDMDSEEDSTYEVELEIIDPKGVKTKQQFISHLMKVDDVLKLIV